MRLKFEWAFQDQSGFSLVEILIGASMLGLIAVGAMTMMANTTLSLKKAANKNVELTLQTEINQVISDSEFCKRAVVGYVPAVIGYRSSRLLDPVTSRS